MTHSFEGGETTKQLSSLCNHPNRKVTQMWDFLVPGADGSDGVADRWVPSRATAGTVSAPKDCWNVSGRPTDPKDHRDSIG